MRIHRLLAALVLALSTLAATQVRAATGDCTGENCTKSDSARGGGCDRKDQITS